MFFLGHDVDEAFVKDRAQGWYGHPPEELIVVPESVSNPMAISAGAQRRHYYGVDLLDRNGLSPDWFMDAPAVDYESVLGFKRYVAETLGPVACHTKVNNDWKNNLFFLCMKEIQERSDVDFVPGNHGPVRMYDSCSL